MDFNILISEDELYTWSSCLGYRLPRNAYAHSILLSNNEPAWRNSWRLTSDVSSDGLFLALFDVNSDADARSIKYGATVPFWTVKKLLALDSDQAAILSDRYQGLGLVVELMDESLAKHLKDFRDCERFRSIAIDVEEGAKGLLEYFGVSAPRQSSKIIKTICKTLEKPDSADFFSALLTYSRGETWPCDGWLAAMCDLGVVMRKTFITEKSSKIIDSFSRSVTPLVKSNSDSIDSVLNCICACPKHDGLTLSNTVFLRWKYAAEQKAGVLNLDLMSMDVALLQKIDNDSCAIALCMFGAFAGFRAFSVEYHRKMRDEKAKGMK